MQRIYTAQGTHALLDCFACPSALLTNMATLQAILLDAAQQAGAHVLAQHFHHFGEDQGVTGVLLLQESHISIHTWPEQGFAAVDVFMCGNTDIQAAVQCIQQGVQAKTVSVQSIQRGA